MKEISFRNDVLPLKNGLYRLALRITLSREEAEDIVQDTLIKVWNARDKWQDIDSVEAYTYTIARNLALDRMQKAEKRATSLDEAFDDRPDSSSTPYEKTLQSDRMGLVRRLIDQLPEKQKSCMQLRDIEGKSYKEIAAILGISEEQVKVSIFRARQAVKKKFEQYDEYGL